MVNTTHGYIKGLPKPTLPAPIPSNCLRLRPSLWIESHHSNNIGQKAHRDIQIIILSQGCLTRKPTKLILDQLILFTEFFTNICLGFPTSTLLVILA